MLIRTIGSIAAFSCLCCAAAGQCPPQRIGSPALTEMDSFGHAVALSGDWLFIADEGYDGFDPTQVETNSGAVFAYRRGGAGGWDMAQRIEVEDPALYDHFGASLSADGAQIAIGATGFANRIHIFELSADRWVETGRIEAPAARGGLGYSVALEGDTLVAGGSATGSPPIKTGAAFVYERVAGEWRLIEELLPPEPRERGEFGTSVAISGSWIAVGEPVARSWDPLGEGRVHLYQRLPGGGIGEPVTVMAPPALGDDRFGAKVLFDGGSLFVGAPEARETPAGLGAVYEFQDAAGAWTLQKAFTADRTHFLGSDIAVSGDLIYALADGPEIYRFRRSDASLLQVVHAVGPDFYTSITADSSQLFVGNGGGGMPRNGRVWVFDVHCMTCAPDLDGDGALTFFDFLAFFAYYSAEDRRADWTRDGRFTVDDYRAFAADFAAGCEAP